MKKTMDILDKNRYIILFFTFAALAFMFPYVHDDWAWGSIIGLERLYSGFKGYNGRYLSNLIALALTRSNILKAVVMSLTIVSITYLIEKLTECKNSFYISLFLLLLMHRNMFKTTITWTAAFSNYTISIVFMLYYLLIVKRAHEEKYDKNFLMAFIVLLLNFFGSLIIEHVTIFNVVSSFLILIYFVLKKKKNVPIILFAFIGAVLGMALMFSNAILAGGYRSVAEDGPFWTVITNYKQVVYLYGFMSNVWLNICISFVLTYLYFKTNAKNKWVTTATITVNIISFYSFFSTYVIIGKKVNSLVNLESVLAFLGLFLMFVLVLYYASQINQTKKYAVLITSILLLDGVLLPMRPIGERCFVASYALLIVIVCSMIADFRIFSSKKVEDFIISLVKAGTLSVFVGLFLIFFSVSRADKKRLKNIKADIEQGKTPVMVHLPYEEFLWMSTPVDEVFEMRYKLFYSLPEDTKFEYK